jgi:tryptophanyl-tRNA synthetase
MSTADAPPPPASGAAVAPGTKAAKQDVNPWSVAGEVDEDGKTKAIDYRKLVDEFGTKLIDGPLLERFERVTGHRPHRLLRRGIVFSERDLGVILDRYERGEDFFLYTGRGPSSDSMHIGHTQIFDFCKLVEPLSRRPSSPP